MTNPILKRGQGWRLGYRPDAVSPSDDKTTIFVALVGADDWAFELTEAEFSDFRRLLVRLDKTMQAAAAELSDEERLACEVESQWLWMEAEGFPQAYRIRLILNTGRGCEGEWPPDAVRELLDAAQSLHVF
ncbi:DUF1818 family protein [Baaleninema simplex]|uniref:DUF1818 family protein n=1 Tax=Baaleninema simplex TaxID=2862350 RepID=UPI000345D996|nr:DUF1818 family protein [Baaleninema simplex]